MNTKPTFVKIPQATLHAGVCDHNGGAFVSACPFTFRRARPSKVGKAPPLNVDLPERASGRADVTGTQNAGRGRDDGRRKVVL